MSGFRKLLFCGAACCLLASLMVPTSEGARPNFRKIWQNNKSSSKRKTVKSYPIPKELRQQYAQPRQSQQPQSNRSAQQPVATGDDAQTPVMKELQELYRQDGQQAPNMARNQPRQQYRNNRPQQKSGNVFSRTYHKIVGKPKQQPSYNQRPAYQPDGLPNWEQNQNQNRPQQNNGTATARLNPAQLNPAQLNPTKAPESSVIIIPPQPQPGLLSGLDVSDVEVVQPDILKGSEPLDQRDPFPLPPLPGDNSATLQPELVETPAAVELGKSNSLEMVLPLPGVETDLIITEKEPVAVSQPLKNVEPKNMPHAQVVENHNKAKNNRLPPAPSADGLDTHQASPTFQGWRSRSGQPQPLEPNTLNVPTQMRPAAMPSPAVVRKQDSSAKYNLIASRGDRNGFKGFCPAVLRDELELVDASPQFRVEYEGAIYYFSSATAMSQFQANPVRYAPAFGGIDIVNYQEQGIEKPGRLDYAVWYHDRLHFFASKESMSRFKSAPENFLPQK